MPFEACKCLFIHNFGIHENWLVTKSHEFNWSMLLHLWVKDSQCIIKIGTYNKKLDRGGATA